MLQMEDAARNDNGYTPDFSPSLLYIGSSGLRTNSYYLREYLQMQNAIFSEWITLLHTMFYYYNEEIGKTS